MFVFCDAHLLLGKLRLVKNLLEKLENILTNLCGDRRESNFVDALEISTFLDTPLEEFIESDQV